MEEIKFYKNIDIKEPVMIAGWPGMGSVALGVVDYLKKNLNAVKLADINIDPMTTLDSVVVEDGVASIPPAPRNVLYYTKKPELIIFEGEAQIPGASGIRLLNRVLDVASNLGVRRIYTGAAFPLPISYKEAPEIYVAANKKSLLDPFKKLGVRSMEGGHISGLNGLILGFALERKIEAICLLATMPQYAIGLPNPKASRAIIETLRETLSFEIDTKEFDEYIKDMDEKMAIVEDKVKDVLTIEKEEPEAPPVDKKIPGYIMEKIEKLFREAKADRSKAAALKKELDRWDLYKLYEDRFLDLFRESQ